MATILGRVGEHLAPLIIFMNYGIKPKDLKFLGNSVDYIAFKGLSDGRIEEVVFIEVKTGKTTTLTQHEREIKRAIELGRFKWLTVRQPTEIDKLTKTIEFSRSRA